MLSGRAPGLPVPVGPTVDEQRATLDAVTRELARLRALRRVAIRAGRAARIPHCGEGTVAVDDEGQLVLTDRHGVPVTDLVRCDGRTCYRCSRRQARARARHTARALHVGYAGLSTCPLLGVLTFRPPDVYVTSGALLDALSSALRRWQRSKAVRDTLAGGQLDEEMTRSTPETREARAREYLDNARAIRRGKRHRRRGEPTVADYEAQAGRLLASLDAGEWWHAHANALLVPVDYERRSRLTLDELTALRDAWRAALAREWVARGWDADPGGMLRVELPRRGLDGAARECVKYAVKGSDLSSLDDGDLAEALLGLDGRRLSRAWGVVADWRRAVREADDEKRPAYEGDGEDEHSYDEDEGERVVDEEKRGEREYIGRTSKGTPVKRSQVQWHECTGELAWRVHLTRVRARDAWLARVRAPS